MSDVLQQVIAPRSRRARGPTLPLLIAVLACLCLPQSGFAAALDADSCSKLKVQQDEMEKAGLKDLVGKGPEWAKANLPQEKLNDIKRWIEVDEQLLFRCPGRHLVNLPLEPDPPPPPPAEDKKPDGEKADAPVVAPRPAAPVEKKAAPPAQAADKKAAQPEKKAPEKKPQPQPQRKPPPAKEKTDTGSGDEQEVKPAPKVKATSKQKPKDDAYKPPTSDPNNPFGLN